MGGPTAQFRASVSRETFGRLQVYVDTLLHWQRSINLVSPNTVEQVWERHIEDCWQVASMVESGQTVVDLGSGAGLPGLVIAIRMAELGTGTVHLVESNGKKASFLRATLRALQLPGGVTIDVHNGRIDSVLPSLGDVDVVTARALASTEALMDMVLSGGAGGTCLLLMKGRKWEAEIACARRRFAFDLKVHGSQNDVDAAILTISELRKISD